MAFTTPFAVLIITGIGMIVINYFLAFSLKINPPQAKAEGPLLLSTPNNAILDWAALPPADLAGPFQNKKPFQQPRFSPTLNNIKNTPTVKQSAGALHPDAYLRGLEKKKVEYEIKKTELLLKYTTRHPDVILVKRQLKQLEEERQLYLRKRKSGAA